MKQPYMLTESELDLIRLIYDGRRRFSFQDLPADNPDARRRSLKAWNAITGLLSSLHERGLIAEVKPHSNRRSFEMDVDFVLIRGGLTPAGESAVRQADDLGSI